MGSIPTWFADAWRRSERLIHLAVVPLVTALLAFEKVQQALSVAGPGRFHAGVAIRFPAVVVDLWSFVSLPSAGPGVRVTSPLWLLPVIFVVHSVLAAGYLGSISDGLDDGRYDFAAAVERYFVRLVAYNALVWTVVFAAVVLGVLTGPLVLLLFPLFLLLNYLFFATPYLIVARDTSVVAALRESYARAVDGGPYFKFALQYLAAVLVLSIPTTLMAVNAGPVGILVAAAVTARVGLAFSTGVMRFVHQRTRGPRSD
ncbi:hypothetical protein [Halostella sp. PRR32]|uniref:hypothetical protein n=1 Tax=Halostella sp. PRR32 TaxID=3098147 RepID=UPI002B1E7096|nr:hypothetical protein [Halostella sp. PRR32]